MTRHEYRERQRQAERDASWTRLRERPWSPDDDMRAWDSGQPRVQIVRFPSFEPATLLEVCRHRDGHRLYRAGVTGTGLSAMALGYDWVPADAGVLSAFVDELADLAVPVMPPISGMVGLDGEVTRVMLFGDLSAVVRFQWWSDPPPLWRPLTDRVARFVAEVGQGG